jgi:dihydrolipoamide dehydrogenase
MEHVLELREPQSVAVLGGGPGGYEAALAAAQLGAEVTLVERAGVRRGRHHRRRPLQEPHRDGGCRGRDLGGLRPRRAVLREGESGVALKPEVAINLAAVNKRLLSLARQQSDDMRAQLVDAGVRIISGHGRLDGHHAIVVATGPGGTDFDRVEADTLVVAVGASPRELPTARPDGERILTWTQLYDMKALPEHLIVVGSGVTGAEFASAYMNLGAKVTLISSRDQVLPGEDADAAAVLEKVFTRAA